MNRVSRIYPARLRSPDINIRVILPSEGASPMPYWRLFYHMVWSTKDRLPLLTPDVETVIFNLLRSKAIGLDATVFALNSVLDHVHMVVAIPPKIAVAKFIGQIKAVASTKFNKSGVSEVPFFWQEEYGAFSFDGKRLPNYIAYVERQKEHHALGTIIPVLERIDDMAVRFAHEAGVSYAVEEETWRRELETLAS
jgi:REP element-mobilizing transposase RayT